MTYGSTEDGGATFALTPQEHQDFKEGKPVVKLVGSSQGEARIVLKMTRPRRNRDRYPPEIYGEGYKPPQQK